jgi:O-antigen/teichoic acid export membrane protein
VPDDLASANVNRTYSLAATSIAIFTFTMVFLYPRYVSGEANATLFQATLVVMAVTTFSFGFSAYHYYGASMGDRFAETERATFARRGDRFWLLGTALLFLEPSLVLFTIGLYLVGAAWLALWVAFVVYGARNFPRLQTSDMTD